MFLRRFLVHLQPEGGEGDAVEKHPEEAGGHRGCFARQLFGLTPHQDQGTVLPKVCVKQESCHPR